MAHTEQSEGPQNYFELYGIPKSYEVDQAEIEKSYFELHKTNHPDGAYEGHVPVLTQEQKDAKTYNASVINDAYQVLRDPLLRAMYLINLAGRDAENLKTDEETLMQSMEDREALQSATTSADVLRLSNEAAQAINGIMTELSTAFADDNIDDAETLTAKLKYQAKFSEEIEQKLKKLKHAA